MKDVGLSGKNQSLQEGAIARKTGETHGTQREENTTSTQRRTLDMIVSDTSGGVCVCVCVCVFPPVSLKRTNMLFLRAAMACLPIVPHELVLGSIQRRGVSNISTENGPC